METNIIVAILFISTHIFATDNFNFVSAQHSNVESDGAKTRFVWKYSISPRLFSHTPIEQRQLLKELVTGIDPQDKSIIRKSYKFVFSDAINSAKNNQTSATNTVTSSIVANSSASNLNQDLFVLKEVKASDAKSKNVASKVIPKAMESLSGTNGSIILKNNEINGSVFEGRGKTTINKDVSNVSKEETNLPDTDTLNRSKIITYSDLKKVNDFRSKINPSLHFDYDNVKEKNVASSFSYKPSVETDSSGMSAMKQGKFESYNSIEDNSAHYNYKYMKGDMDNCLSKYCDGSLRELKNLNSLHHKLPTNDAVCVDARKNFDSFKWLMLRYIGLVPGFTEDLGKLKQLHVLLSLFTRLKTASDAGFPIDKMIDVIAPLIDSLTDLNNIDLSKTAVQHDVPVAPRSATGFEHVQSSIISNVKNAFPENEEIEKLDLDLPSTKILTLRDLKSQPIRLRIGETIDIKDSDTLDVDRFVNALLEKYYGIPSASQKKYMRGQHVNNIKMPLNDDDGGNAENLLKTVYTDWPMGSFVYDNEKAKKTTEYDHSANVYTAVNSHYPKKMEKHNNKWEIDYKNLFNNDQSDVEDGDNLKDKYELNTAENADNFAFRLYNQDNTDGEKYGFSNRVEAISPQSEKHTLLMGNRVESSPEILSTRQLLTATKGINSPENYLGDLLTSLNFPFYNIKKHLSVGKFPYISTLKYTPNDIIKGLGQFSVPDSSMLKLIASPKADENIATRAAAIALPDITARTSAQDEYADSPKFRCFGPLNKISNKIPGLDEEDSKLPQ